MSPLRLKKNSFLFLKKICIFDLKSEPKCSFWTVGKDVERYGVKEQKNILPKEKFHHRKKEWQEFKLYVDDDEGH